MPFNEPRLFWVALNLVKGIGSVRFKALVDHFGDAHIAWEAPPTALRAAGLSEKIVNNLKQVRASVDLKTVWEQLDAHQITLITWLDENYPRRLKEVHQSPPVLYSRGQLIPEDEWAIAVVGTRRVSAYGRQVTEALGSFLARNGVTVVSGLARGVDAIAHQAALDAGGRTIAVLGNGLDRIYPPENRKLAEDIIENGALISDYSLGTPPESSNFPPRNRIISGLSIAVVVVEAGERSGALITASFAAEQGREVFAVPGNIFAAHSKGTNRLIQKGAHPLLNPEDLLESLNLTLVTEHKTARTVLPADGTEAKLFGILDHEPKHIDEIGSLAKLPIEKVSATLALMELKGMVRQVGGMNYVALRELKAKYEVDEKST
ncbi:MAG: DNA-protecting protein DprA [Chloroflexi bacterium]|nr:DNA-protecting protein DprA [Chloroflexota bacterium]